MNNPSFPPSPNKQRLCADLLRAGCSHTSVNNSGARRLWVQRPFLPLLTQKWCPLLTAPGARFSGTLRMAQKLLSSMGVRVCQPRS